MITLYTFGPAFGLPDPSPFVTKAITLLKLSGLSFRQDTSGFRKAPKGKLPYMDDDGAIVADSTFIRQHLERKHGIDFDQGLTAEQRAFFKAVPAPVRPVIKAVVRRKIRRNLHAHGLGRHDNAQIAELAKRDLDALSAIIGSKPYLMGEAPCGADATVFAFVASSLCPRFETPIRTAAEGHGNLVAYCDRTMQRYFPETAKAA